MTNFITLFLQYFSIGAGLLGLLYLISLFFRDHRRPQKMNLKLKALWLTIQIPVVYLTAVAVLSLGAFLLDDYECQQAAQQQDQYILETECMGSPLFHPTWFKILSAIYLILFAIAMILVGGFIVWTLIQSLKETYQEHLRTLESLERRGK